MVLVAIGRKNRITEILEGDESRKKMSIYELCQKMNERRPKGAREIHYKTVYNIVNSDSIPYGTHYGNVALIADVLGVSVNDLEK